MLMSTKVGINYVNELLSDNHITYKYKCSVSGTILYMVDKKHNKTIKQIVDNEYQMIDVLKGIMTTLEDLIDYCN